MKKILILFVAISAMLASCSKDKEDNYDNSPMVGTVWEKSSLFSTTRLTFRDETCSFNNEYMSGYKYKCNYPTVILYPFDDDYADLRCVINGSSMTIYHTETNEVLYQLTKK